MNKVICDVCGTAFPETAEQCPICGCAKPEEAGKVKTYTYVKGGRFSSKNVKKRNKEKQLNRAYNQIPEEDEDEQDENSGSNRGLLIAVILLLLAIFAVVAYLYINYWMPDISKPDSTGSTSTTAAADQTTGSTEGTTEGTEETSGTTAATVSDACTGIVLTDTEITLTSVGDGYLLNYTLEPADTTDPVSYESSDPDVATVDANGKITAVGPGSATVTITCGSVQTQCTVTCDIETEPTTEPTTAPTTEPEVVFELNREDITLKSVGESWTLYNGTIGRTQITWWVDDESVATVKNGTVTAVAEGVTTLYAQYEGVICKCIIRVKFS